MKVADCMDLLGIKTLLKNCCVLLDEKDGHIFFVQFHLTPMASLPHLESLNEINSYPSDLNYVPRNTESDYECDTRTNDYVDQIDNVFLILLILNIVAF